MSVLRKEKKSNFTVIDNAIFKDRSLSLKAMGLLCLMLSLPDGWEYSVKGLQTLVTDKYSAITSGLKELEQAGYFRREQRFEKGKFAGYEYIISETKNLDFTFSENPISGNTITENTISENPTQLNTKELNTKKNKVLNKLSTKELYSEFENLWSVYPRKQGGKDKAFGYYEKARKSGTTYEEVLAGIQAYIDYIEANETDMQYVKMGTTFFSQKAWGDDWSIRHNTSPRKKGINETFAEIFEEHKYDL